MMTMMMMSRSIVVVAASAALALPAGAESFASSASSAGSASSASVSDSIQGSSQSSTRGGQVAAGEYRIVALAPLDGGRQRVELQSVQEAARRFALLLPVAAAPLAVGEVVAVHERPYGYAFARGPVRETFFVALAEGWVQDQDLKAVTL